MPDEEQRCRKCGEPKRPGMRCLPCQRARYNPEKARAANRAWKAANPEKVKAYSVAHRQEVREAGRRWDNTHKTERAARSAQRANTEEFRARRRARYAANPQKAAVYYKKWRDANPEKVRAINRAEALRRHGITSAQFDAVLSAQGGVCRICDAIEPGGHGTWHIDHDHACCPGNRYSCGRCVRGLLCHYCNLMLGNAHDNADVLRRAIEYLEASKGLRAVAGGRP